MLQAFLKLCFIERVIQEEIRGFFVNNQCYSKLEKKVIMYAVIIIMSNVLLITVSIY